VLRLAVPALLLMGGCMFLQRDPETAVCADVAISEIRKAASSDTLVSWVELYNTTASPIGMRGLELRFRNPTGASETDVVIKRDFDAAPGAYVTLGLASDDDSMRPAYLDYGFLDDFTGTWPSDAALELDSCDTKIDLVQYGSLPSMGTLSLDGANPPSADDNDFVTNFCTDATLVGTTYPGTPQHPNITCPVTP
jgi:hypothetical protein